MVWPIRTGIVAFVAFVFIFWLPVNDATGQYFGRNKVQYENFDFEILKTEHFDIYYYPAEREAVLEAARLAERWYARLSQVLDHQFTDRQPLILYGSHPDFAQTNVISNHLGEEVGGVTESLKRRIAMPFAPGLAQTDHILGHEIVHAFQFDISRKHRASMAVPLWFVEGMAEYLSLGSVDPLTAMWMRDAASGEKLPSIEELGRTRVSPYRFGHALWAYLAGRFGDEITGRALKTPGNVVRRLEAITGVDIETLSADWHKAVREYSRISVEANGDTPTGGGRLLVGAAGGGRVNVSPALSPDGRSLIFLSEKEQFSIDVYLADAVTGQTRRKLVTTATDPYFDSVQATTSSGAWHPAGRLFVLAAVRRGHPVLAIIDTQRARRVRDIRLEQFGQVLNPVWSPDGGSIAFSALKAGFTDLYVYDVVSGDVQQLTADAFADLQPAWSPDGRQLAFVTDRFSTDLTTLRFGKFELAVIDLEGGPARRLTGIPGARHFGPQWAPDGSSIFFVADPDGINNVFRVSVDDGKVYRVTHVETGVSGLAPLSPALTVASAAGNLAYSLYRGGGFEVYAIEGEEQLAGTPFEPRAGATAAVIAAQRDDSQVAGMLEDVRFGLQPPGSGERTPYRSRLTLDALGTPYIAAGGGAFGSFVRGGMSVYLGDMLGDRRLAAAIQVGNDPRDLQGVLFYRDRTTRWNWNGIVEQSSFIRGLSRERRGEMEGSPALTREIERLRQVHRRVGAAVEYPLSRAQRFELAGGLRNITFDSKIDSRTFSLPAGRLLVEEQREVPGGGAVHLAEVSAAFVYDTAIRGPVSPIAGSRYRLEVGTSHGTLSLTNVLVDYRHYLMPVRPFTVAVRLLHSGRYGGGADDPRLLPLYLGYHSLVRGYEYGSFRRPDCGPAPEGGCPARDELYGNRVLVGKAEVRFPLLNPTSRRLDWGRVPIEGLVFADAGVAWNRGQEPVFLGGDRPLVRSVGAGVRVNLVGMLLEFDAVRPLDRVRPGWRFAFGFRPGF
jgi:hypothetical protein